MVKSNIALIGFMGTGKSTIGKALAASIGKSFLEMDAMIEKRAALTIPEIFQQSEIVFREYEMALCKEIGENVRNSVIATGGGVVLNQLNLSYLRQSCVLILLESSIEEIYTRCMKDGADRRPVIDKEDPKEEIQNQLDFRSYFYRTATEFKIDTTGKQVSQIVDEILQILQ